jgi:hypothetical protein
MWTWPPDVDVAWDEVWDLRQGLGTDKRLEAQREGERKRGGRETKRRRSKIEAILTDCDDLADAISSGVEDRHAHLTTARNRGSERA